MKVNGVWVGWGPGDRGEFVVKWKAFLKRKFTWVRQSPLNDDDFYDDTLALVVMELQTRYHLPVTGITNAELQIRSGFLKVGPPPDDRPVFYTVCGTSVPWWVGPDADLARYLADDLKIVRWQPVGYRAAPFPMWPSIEEGVAELWRLFNLPENAGRRFYLCGFSQGAIVVSLFYLRFIKGNPELEKRFIKGITWGNPMREQGHCFHDGVGQMANINNAGILDERLVDTPANWRDYGHKGDLYTDCGFDEAGENQRAICKVIMWTRVLSGPDSIIAQLLEFGQNPFGGAVGVFMALINAGMFFLGGTKPHLSYDIRAAADFVKAR